MNDFKSSDFKIVVYCSAADSLPVAWVEAAARLGHWIGSVGATLVYGGVDAGLMRVVARAVKTADSGQIIGVVPMLRSDKASPLNDIEIPAEGLADCKANMQLMSDAFVVLPGGYGTLDEMISTLSYLAFNHITDKPLILYNPDGLYDATLEQFNTMIARGVMQQRCLDCLTVATTTDEIIEILKTKIQKH